MPTTTNTDLEVKHERQLALLEKAHSTNSVPIVPGIPEFRHPWEGTAGELINPRTEDIMRCEEFKDVVQPTDNVGDKTELTCRKSPSAVRFRVPVE